MIVDHTLTPLQNVINLINETNGTTFTADDFVLSELTQTDLTGDITVKNSTILVTCTLNNEFYGNQTLAYRRLYIQEIVKSDQYALQDGDTLDSIREMVATRYKMIADELEWDQPTLDVAPGETKPYVLRAKVGSMCYIGELEIHISKS
ncbi:hypothetical protein D3C85_128160 [compost metagenome]